jgi:hypothetical protein
MTRGRAAEEVVSEARGFWHPGSMIEVEPAEPKEFVASDYRLIAEELERVAPAIGPAIDAGQLRSLASLRLVERIGQPVAHGRVASHVALTAETSVPIVQLERRTRRGGRDDLLHDRRYECGGCDADEGADPPGHAIASPLPRGGNESASERNWRECR